MKYYTSTTEFNGGIDLHSRQMYVCVMDRAGNKLLHTNIQGNDFAYFLKRIEPYRHDLTVCCECTFNWYWLADACQREGLTFVLAHALYLKAIHGGKNKNDRIDSEKLAHLLRSNLIPPATSIPARSVRCARCCGNGSATSGGGRSCSRASKAINWPRVRRRPNRDPWEQRLLASYEHDHPLHTTTLEIDLAMIRANAILAHKLARAVYFMLQRGTGFDVEKLVATSVGGAMKAA